MSGEPPTPPIARLWSGSPEDLLEIVHPPDGGTPYCRPWTGGPLSTPRPIRDYLPLQGDLECYDAIKEKIFDEDCTAEHIALWRRWRWLSFCCMRRRKPEPLMYDD